MDPVDFHISSDPGPEFLYPRHIQQSFFYNLIPGVQQPLFPFGMIRRNRPIEGGEKHKSDVMTSGLHQLRPPFRPAAIRRTSGRT